MSLSLVLLLLLQNPQNPTPDPHNNRPPQDKKIPVTAPAEGTKEDDQEGGQDDRELGTRDPALEKRAEKNIEIAQFYMKQKNFKASINRLTEIYEVYPQYTHFEKVLLLLGRAHLGQSRLLADEAKQLAGQKQDDKAKAKQSEADTNAADAKKYFQELVAKFADTDAGKDAKKELEKLK